MQYNSAFLEIVDKVPLNLPLSMKFLIWMFIIFVTHILGYDLFTV